MILPLSPVSDLIVNLGEAFNMWTNSAKLFAATSNFSTIS